MYETSLFLPVCVSVFILHGAPEAPA